MVEVIRVRGGGPCGICEAPGGANISPTCEHCGAKTSDICFACARGNCPRCGDKLVKPPGFAQRVQAAIEQASIESLELELAKNGDELEPLVRAGDAPTFRAAMHKDAERAREMCQLLLSHGVPVDARDREGRTALIYMMFARPPVHRGVAELFRSAVNAQDSRGRTALMFAVSGAGMFASRKGSVTAVRLLLDLGADLLIQTESGRTALGYAMADNDKGTNEDMVSFIKKETLAAVAMAEFRARFRVSIDEKGVVHHTPK